MALLDGDGFWSARGLIGRVSDYVREIAAGLSDRAGTRAPGLAPAASRSSVRPPRWMRPVIKAFAPLLEFARKLVAMLWPGGPVATSLSRWLRRTAIVKFISQNLLRRILFSNLIGFAILFIGVVYLSLDSSWLINAKRDALKIQGEIIAAAIVGDAKVTSTEFTIDPETIHGKKAAQVPLRGDAFTTYEFSIQPQQVAPILNRLIKPTKTRARIYDDNGWLVVDSSTLLRRGQIIGTNAKKPKKNTQRPRTKNFWTRLQHWLINKEVQVYKEIGTANGKYYPEVRAALTGNTEAMLLLNRKGEQIVSMAVPIRKRGQVVGVLLLSTQPGDVDEILAKDREAIWPLAALALIASIVTSLLMARTVAGPMKRLSETAERVSRDINAHKDLPSYSERNDEVGQMANAFRSMTAALFERIEASEKFAADVAHELKNPLTAASSTAQSLEYAKTDDDREQLVQQIQIELNRLNRLITDVSSASRLNAELARQSAEPVAIDAVLRNIMSIFDDKSDNRGCALLLDVSQDRSEDDFTISGNEGRIAQVFTNIVDNALSFAPDNSKIQIRARRVGDFIEVSVEDDGPGIEEDKLETIFSRFYTYRPTQYSSRGDNSGLGLSISSEIIRAHGGKIWAENRISTHGDNAGKPIGSRFKVLLPARVVATRGTNTGRTGQATRQTSTARQSEPARGSKEDS